MRHEITTKAALRKMATAVCAAALLTASATADDPILVDDDADLGGDGKLWSTAYKYLQDAIAEAEEGDVIWVAEGIYYPDEDEGGNWDDNDRTSTFELEKDVWLYGGFENGDLYLPDRDPIANPTILSGDIQQDDDTPPDITDTDRQNNAYHVVTGSQETDPVADGARIDGFIITGGYADGSTPNGHGGAVLQGGDRLVRCTFCWNFAEVGGGAIATNYPAVIYNCRFYKNYAGDDNDEGTGGAITFQQQTDNYVSYVVNSVFYANEAKDHGGAIYVGTPDESLVEISNCTIGHSDDDYGNVSYNGGGGVYAAWGGSLYDVHVVVQISNSIVQYNNTEVGYVTHADLLCEPGVPDDYCGVLVYSLADAGWDGFGGLGNCISVATDFLNPAGCDNTFVTADDNFMLAEDVGGYDDGSTTWIQKDFGDLNDDGTTDEDIPIDLHGWDRKDPAGSVDMGAVAFPWLCMGDLDASDEVDIDDLFAVLAGWGSCSCGLPADCLCDLNADCVVDIDDLFVVLDNWGICPSGSPSVDECVEDCFELYTAWQDILDCLNECD